MKRTAVFFALTLLSAALVLGQTTNVSSYKKTSKMVPMRDGTKLFTVILTPVNSAKPLPIIFERTPYGADFNLPDDSTIAVRAGQFPFEAMAREGYIFVFQDIRGKYKSEGKMQIHQPLVHNTK